MSLLSKFFSRKQDLQKPEPVQESQDNYKYCPHCKAQVKAEYVPDATLCSQCGYVLSDDSPQIQYEEPQNNDITMYCPNCDAQVPVNTSIEGVFCARCNTELIRHNPL